MTQKNKSFLLKKLDSLGAARPSNSKTIIDLLEKKPTLFPSYLAIVFSVNKQISIKAARFLEFVCLANINVLTPCLTYFTKNLKKVSKEASVRSMARICELIAKDYNTKNNSEIKQHLNKAHIENIIEVSFDWLISNHKVAVKAYSMTTLFIFAKQHPWIYKELKLVIEQNITQQSKAYKARGKKILLLIQKNNNTNA